MAQLVGRYAVRLIGRINRARYDIRAGLLAAAVWDADLMTRRTRTVPLDQRANPNTLR
jgi:hypothetical protein